MKTLANYFFRGLLVLFPAYATVYLLVAGVRWVDGLLSNLLAEQFGIVVPGLGLLIVLGGVTLMGFLFSRAFVRPVLAFLERLITRVPLVSIVYASLKELTEAFVGDKKKFNKPVLVNFPGSGVNRVGFLTREEVGDLGLEGHVAVYCPHSYNFSGNLYLVPSDCVRRLDVNASDAMRYAVSAGATKLG